MNDYESSLKQLMSLRRQLNKVEHYIYRYTIEVKEAQNNLDLWLHSKEQLENQIEVLEKDEEDQ